MQVKVDILEGLQRKVTIEVPADVVSEKVLQKLKKAQKTARIDGFRKGKVPMNIVQKRYGAAIHQEVLGDLIESSYFDAVKSEKLIPAAQPEIKPISGFSEGEPFVFEATLEIVPEFDVAGLDDMKITKAVSEIAQSDIDEMLTTLRKQLAKWIESDDSAGEGDRVTVQFEGKIDGEVFEGGTAEELPFIIGVGQMLEDFEKPVFGKKAGDEVNATVNFPEDYPQETIAGKTAEFAIKVLKIEKPELPEMTEEFIKGFGIEDGTQESLEKAIRDNMTRELDTALRKDLNQKVMAHLVDANQAIMLPESMVSQEKLRMAHEQNLEKHVPDEKERERIISEEFDEPARRRVLLGLVMGKLFEERDIKPDGKRVEAHIEKIASTYEDPQEVREYFSKTPQEVERIYAQVMEEQLIDELLEKAEVSEEQKSFSEIMGRA